MTAAALICVFKCPCTACSTPQGDTPSGQIFDDPKTWSRTLNLGCWQLYLGDQAADNSLSPYASPLLSHDLSGLPPAFLSVGAVDTLRDENIAYAARLLQAGVPVELHVWPGVYHAVEFQTPQCPTSRRILSEYSAALKRAFSPPL